MKHPEKITYSEITFSYLGVKKGEEENPYYISDLGRIIRVFNQEGKEPVIKTLFKPLIKGS